MRKPWLACLALSAALSLSALSGCAKTARRLISRAIPRSRNSPPSSARSQRHGVYSDGTNAAVRDKRRIQEGLVQSTTEQSSWASMSPGSNRRAGCEQRVHHHSSPTRGVIGQPRGGPGAPSPMHHDDTGLLTPLRRLTSPSRAAAQGQMKKRRPNSALMNGNRERAKTLLSQYVTKIGDLQKVEVRGPVQGCRNGVGFMAESILRGTQANAVPLCSSCRLICGQLITKQRARPSNSSPFRSASKALWGRA